MEQARNIQTAPRRPQEWWRETASGELSEKVEDVTSSILSGPRLDEDNMVRVDENKHGCRGPRLRKETRSHLALRPHSANAVVPPPAQLHWPVMFIYPAPAQTDFIEQFFEGDNIQAHLSVMFPDEPQPAVPWDERNEYKYACGRCRGQAFGVLVFVFVFFFFFFFFPFRFLRPVPPYPSVLAATPSCHFSLPGLTPQPPNAP